MNKKVIFLVLSLIVSSCSSGNENTIDELEEQIVVLENKEDLDKWMESNGIDEDRFKTLATTDFKLKKYSKKN